MSQPPSKFVVVFLYMTQVYYCPSPSDILLNLQVRYIS